MNILEKTTIEMPVDAMLLAPTELPRMDSEVLRAITFMLATPTGSERQDIINLDFAMPPFTAARNYRGREIGIFMREVEEKIGGMLKSIRITENRYDMSLGIGLRSFSLQPRTRDGDIDLSEVMDKDLAPPTVGIKPAIEFYQGSLPRHALVAFAPNEGVTELVSPIGDAFQRAIWPKECLVPTNEGVLRSNGDAWIRASQNVILIKCAVVDESLLKASGIPHHLLTESTPLRDEMYFCRFFKSRSTTAEGHLRLGLCD